MGWPSFVGCSTIVIIMMIYLDKILPVFFLPVGVAILLGLASLLFRKRALGVAAVLVLWLSSTPLVGDMAIRAAEGWQHRIPVQLVPQARAIVVLTGMLVPAQGAESENEWGGAVDRFDAGVALFKAGKAPLLIFTGGWVPWRPEAPREGDVLADRAVALGVPRNQIVVTGKVSNTAGEAREVAALLRNLNQDRADDVVILVTSAFHVRRSRLQFTRAGVPVFPFPVDFQALAGPFTVMDVLPSAHGLGNTETALRELYGYLFYRLTLLT